MDGESVREFTASDPAPWLEVIDRSSPILLIAPHGGRAETAFRGPNPKVNDLHTAEITRTLAGRFGASALVNFAMDRNRLDCNRLGQLAERAPWLLEIIAGRIEEMVASHGRAIVLLIHGWNIIEPRVDFGLGARLRNGRLVPAGHGHISAGDEFINRTVVAIAERLRAGGIVPDFGVRYPAGGFHNLLQVFTARHLESPLPALRRLATIAATGAIDAVQLELSVAVRMPGSMRNCALDAISAAFPIDAAQARDGGPAMEVVRAVVRTPAAKAPAPSALKAPTTGIPARAGIEFFDPAAGIGAMASFDFGPTAMGARIMMMLDHRRVALFTGEGAVHRDGGRISLGPLALHAEGREIALTFRGPAVLVPDARAYLSIERALASGILDEAAMVSVRLRVPDASLNLEEVLQSGKSTDPVSSDPVAAFGRLTGTIAIAGETRTLDGVGRAGLSFTGIGSANFVSRRMVWACLPAGSPYSALEARLITNEDGTGYRAARVFGRQGWRPCDLTEFDLETASAESPPEKIALTLALDGAPLSLAGEVRSFVPLSRPGPNQSRIYTSIGFASFRGSHEGAGMFEYSRRVTPEQATQAELSDQPDDAD
jgi:hypothetical protein